MVHALLDVAARERVDPERYESSLAGAFADVWTDDPGPDTAAERLLDGLRLHRPELRERMRDSLLGAFGLVDVAALDEVIAAGGVPGEALHHTLAAESWLAGIDRAAPMWESAVPDRLGLLRPVR